MDTPSPGIIPVDQEEITPQRAARRLYDEMALAYREQAEDDLALNQKLLPASSASANLEESE